MTLDLDKRVLCFDGVIQPDLDTSLSEKLNRNGLFVVRSPGGDPIVAMKLADQLRQQEAIVVVYDYCMSACANFLLIAASETYVLRDTIVGWHLSSVVRCAALVEAADGGPRRLDQFICSDETLRRRTVELAAREMEDRFYAERLTDPAIEMPPESIPIRRLLKSMFEDEGRYPNVVWTWHPRYSAVKFKTKVTYQAYPGSQAELDALQSRYGFPSRFLYDP
jgi:hypothetical protein